MALGDVHHGVQTEDTFPVALPFQPRCSRETAVLAFHVLLNWLKSNDDDADRGASLIEYALLVGLIAMVCVAAVTALGGTTSSSYSEVTSMLG